MDTEEPSRSPDYSSSHSPTPDMDSDLGPEPGAVMMTDDENGHEESQDFDYDLIRFLGRNQGLQRSCLNFSHQGNIHEFVCRFVRSFLILLVIYLI